MHHRHMAVILAAASLASVLFPGPVMAAENTPELCVSLESGQPGTVTAGWPLVAIAQITLREGADHEAPDGRLRLASTGEAWTAALQVTVTNGQRQPVSWPWHLVTVPATAVTIDGQTGAVAGWWLSPEETAALVPGVYTMELRLDTTAVTAEGAWRGKAQSPPLELTVAPEPAPLTPVLQEAKLLLIAGWHVLGDRAAEAVSALDVLLSQQPESTGALAFKADLLAMEGQREEALALYDQALALELAKLPPGAKPQRDLLRRRQALAARRN